MCCRRSAFLNTITLQLLSCGKLHFFFSHQCAKPCIKNGYNIFAATLLNLCMLGVGIQVRLVSHSYSENCELIIPYTPMLLNSQMSVHSPSFTSSFFVSCRKTDQSFSPLFIRDQSWTILLSLGTFKKKYFEVNNSYFFKESSLFCRYWNMQNHSSAKVNNQIPVHLNRDWAFTVKFNIQTLFL